MAPRGIGELKFRVRFDKKVAADDPAGGTMGDWTPQFTRFAAIAPNIGGEQVMAQRLTAKQPVNIFVRYDSQTLLIDPTWRAVEMRDDTEFCVYALKTAEDMERNKMYITLLGVAGEADA